jgi:antitoxin component YwqK of YwqJK toxin-antitoxin module
MTNKIFYLLLLISITYVNTYSQNINLDEYEVYIGDTLISKFDFIKNGQNLKEEQTKKLEFKPISNGDKKAYYLSGKIYSIGKIKNLTKNGYWEFWHPNGEKAREGNYIDGKQDGTHKYWFQNGILRGLGNWKNGDYHGIWETYSIDGKEKTIQVFKDGKEIK